MIFWNTYSLNDVSLSQRILSPNLTTKRTPFRSGYDQSRNASDYGKILQENFLTRVLACPYHGQVICARTATKCSMWHYSAKPTDNILYVRRYRSTLAFGTQPAWQAKAQVKMPPYYSSLHVSSRFTAMTYIAVASQAHFKLHTNVLHAWTSSLRQSFHYDTSFLDIDISRWPDFYSS